ncbi:hypothetical protein MA16_Dca016012 [Dendrobium catenatum]|uniref:Uncharacterized protein n=1 Tax=Dendrobium catenatum TaxID=906689 RepID=A0A2I0VJQ4_9ASPA|nr:hypothetical protein MA16_Dca016012 [Dendrobium catenatum]
MASRHQRRYLLHRGVRTPTVFRIAAERRSPEQALPLIQRRRCSDLPVVGQAEAGRRSSNEAPAIAKNSIESNSPKRQSHAVTQHSSNYRQFCGFAHLIGKH